MKESNYKSYDELPLFLNAELVSTECGFAASEVKTLGAAIDDAPESDYGTF